MVLQPLYFCWQDGSATATKNPDMTAAVYIQQFEQVGKEFDMAALVRRDRDRLHVFFDSCFRDFVHASVVTEVNHFHSPGLQDTAHDIDRRIVPVEEGGGRDH